MSDITATPVLPVAAVSTDMEPVAVPVSEPMAMPASVAVAAAVALPEAAALTVSDAVAVDGLVDATAADATTAEELVVNAADAAAAAAAVDTESKKRKARSAPSSLDDPTMAAAAASDDVSGENDEEFSDEEHDAAMQDVMAKMKEANEAALHATAAAGGQIVTRAASGGAAGERVQLYDSKRMSRVSFNSWYEFDAYFEMYMQETYQPFRMRSSCSVEAYRRNQQKVMLNNKNSRGRRIEFPDTAIHHHRIYMCTHAMKARCRGATTRPGQKYRGIGCIAKINVKISPSDNPNKYMVIVTDQVVTHNHPISKEIYESYPDVLLKTMRRNQMTTAMLTRQPSPKFDSPSQSQKYERAMTVLNSVADVIARLPDDEYESQMQQLQKFYATILPSDAAHV